MTLTPGARFGPYDVVALLGEGGMGQVYRVRDAKLQRDVAVKVLPEAFAQDRERLARFEREARTLAALNHPNIAHVYGLEEADGIHGLVMELVEGPTLADRVAAGPLPLDEVLPIALQMAEALEAAHEQGIIHRDLKPANVKVRPDGTVKVLDFGLAKALDPVGVSATGASQVPTITTPAMTQAGMILGTAAYMSPEQAKGRPTDKRTDVWAFGCVLYELLTGRRVFAGEDVPDTLANVLKDTPDWRALPADVPGGVRTLLRRCLEKDRKRRLADMADARLELEDARAGAADGAQSVARNLPAALPAWRRAVPHVAALVVGGLLVAVPLWRSRSQDKGGTTPRETHADIVTPYSTEPTSLAMSPDGRQLAFVGTREDGQSLIWVRSLDASTARPIAGTENGRRPFWSPDGQSFAFFASGKLHRVDLGNGSVATVVTDTGSGVGGTWNQDGVILFTPTTSGPVMRTTVSGAVPTAQTQLLAGQNTHRVPHFLPDGRQFLVYARGAPDSTGLYLGRLDDTQVRRVTDADSGAIYSSGHIFYARRGALLAQPFDAALGATTGAPVRIADQVAQIGAGLAAVAGAPGGPVAFRTGASGDTRRFVWVNRAGTVIDAPSLEGDFNSPSLSNDGRRIAFYRGEGNLDIWLYDTTRGALTRFTTDAGADTFPIWSPDGSLVVFQSSRTGRSELYVKPAQADREEQMLARLATEPGGITATDWSRDGRFILYRISQGSGYDLWALPMRPLGRPFPVVQTPADERDGQFSPDGRWVAYQSTRSGRLEVYVRAFPGPGIEVQVSANGGAQVRWRGDGRELYYLGLDERLMAVPMRFGVDGTTVEPGSAIPLFVARIGGAFQGVDTQQYAVAADGQRFLLNSRLQEGPVAPITLILNWSPPSGR